MTSRRVIWPSPIRMKLLSFESIHFTSDETLDFIAHFVLETEQALLNPVISQYYTEDHGEFQGVSRIVIRKFKVYFELIGYDAVILAIKFPRES